jgi:hypothetical protein
MFDRMKQAASEAKFKADQLLRVQRVQNEIGGINQQMRSVSDKIASVVLDLYQRGALPVPELGELCAQVDGLRAQVAQKEAQVAAIKAEQFQAAAPPPPPPPQTYAPPPPPAPAPVATKECPNCHAALPVTAVFCTSCGTKVG